MIDVLTVVIAAPVSIGVAVIMAFYQVVDLVRLITLGCLRVRPGRNGAEVGVHTVVSPVQFPPGGPDDIEWIAPAWSEHGNISAGREVNAIAVDLIIIWLASGGLDIAENGV